MQMTMRWYHKASRYVNKIHQPPTQKRIKMPQGLKNGVMVMSFLKIYFIYLL